jgi:hypothetical protein
LLWRWWTRSNSDSQNWMRWTKSRRSPTLYTREKNTLVSLKCSLEPMLGMFPWTNDR